MSGYVDLKHLNEHNRGRCGNTHRALPALVAQLRARVAQGEDAEAVLDDFGIKKPSLRALYLDGLPSADASGGTP